MVEKFVPEVGQSVLLSCNLNFVSFRALNDVVYMYVHCPNNKLNLRIKTKPVTARADATVYDQLLDQKVMYILYTIAPAPIMTGSVCMIRCNMFLRQCLTVPKSIAN